MTETSLKEGTSNVPVKNKKISKAALLKVNSNYMVIAFRYGEDIVLPHDKGVILMNAMEQAETFKNSYSSCSIYPLEKGSTINSRPLSQADYIKYKMAHILKIPSEELEDVDQYLLK